MALDRIPGDASLYIGALCSLQRKDALKQAHITHIVSVFRRPHPQDIPHPNDFKRLAVEVDDLISENIIQHFPTSNAFIKEGLDAGGGVLVHCAMGKSRSTTILVAYLLTQNPDLNPRTALALIRQCRSHAEPNTGFMTQLHLYHLMRCPASLDDHPVYQRWIYESNVQASRAWGKAPERIHFRNESEASPADEFVYQNWGYQCDVDVSTAIGKVPDCIQFSDMRGDKSRDRSPIEALDPKEASRSSFRCRRCRTSLATSPHLVRHSLQRIPSNLSSSSSTPECAHLFLEPLSWMKAELEQGKLDGRLECPNPKCGANVGKYAWQGMRCNCGEWIVPAVSIARGRVDEVRQR
ncbi:tyrosine protein phosphatase yvh1 [Pseudocyphellaria aurata]|nr:tyrosine protein phosphatase yvh1 [Pseudocyphellaria aurata]